jgi:PAS domain S-box-containing protein
MRLGRKLFSLMRALTQRTRKLKEAERAQRHSEMLMHAMDVILDHDDLDQALNAVLGLCKTTLAADEWLLLQDKTGRALLGGTPLRLDCATIKQFLTQPRRSDNAQGLWGWQALPQEIRKFPAILSHPVNSDYGAPVAIVFLAEHPAAFSDRDTILLARIAELLYHTTRRMQQRSAARRELSRLGKIAELTSNFVVVTDAQVRIEWVNPAFERRTGWTLDEVRGKIPPEILLSDQNDPAELARMHEAVTAGKPCRAELLNRTKSGENYWISKDVQPLLDDRGEIEGFIAVHTEITDLKLTSLRAQKDSVIAMEASRDGIAFMDAEGRYLYMNAAHRRMFGIGESEEIGQFQWQNMYLPKDLERFLAEDWAALEAAGTWQGELTGMCRDGTHVPQEVSLTLQDQGLLCITRDISDRVRLEAERARLREDLQLAQRRETIAQLADGIAHDLNNLVAVVSGSASLLQPYCASHPEASAGVARIIRATDTARDLVSGLRRLDRPQLERSTQDLRQLLREGIELLGSGRIRDYEISVTAPAHDCPVWANATELLQVIVNLALNACEAAGSAPNRVTLQVLDKHQIPVTAPDIGKVNPALEYTVFAVSDSGTGIPAQTRARLFERHFTTKGASGSGLGLPIVVGILRANDALLWVESTEGAGTRMIVAWPSTASTTADVQHATELSPGAPDLTGANILVVDDIADVADVLSEMLETAGALGVAVSDPLEAAELLRDNPGLWQALVTDLDMPVLDGVGLARIAANCVPPIPAVLVTALPEMLGDNAALFPAIVAKPTNSAQLVAAVNAALQRAAQN